MNSRQMPIRLSIKESEEAIAELKTFPEKVRALKKYEKTSRRVEVDRLLEEMEGQFETENLYDEEVMERIIATGEKIKTMLKDKRQAGRKYGSRHVTNRHSKETGEIAPEVEALREVLTADYERAIKNLEWYGILETRDYGESFYIADYDGSTEKDPNDPEPEESKRRACPDAANYSGRFFEIPTLEQIMRSLTLAQAALYREYRENGLEPKLELTPLALKLRTMAAILDAKKEEINVNAGKQLVRSLTYISDKKEKGEIDETTLLYEPQTVEASPDGEQLITTNGISKSQLIEKYGGWLVEIVQMKHKLEPDKDKTHQKVVFKGKTERVEFTNAEKTAMYMRQARENNESGMGYEDYLMAQMNALAEATPIPLEEGTFTILPESSFRTNKDIVANGDWGRARVWLGQNYSNNSLVGLRFRRSVRIYVKPDEVYWFSS